MPYQSPILISHDGHIISIPDIISNEPLILATDLTHTRHCQLQTVSAYKLHKRISERTESDIRLLLVIGLLDEFFALAHALSAKGNPAAMALRLLILA